MTGMLFTIIRRLLPFISTIELAGEHTHTQTHTHTHTHTHTYIYIYIYTHTTARTLLVHIGLQGKSCIEAVHRLLTSVATDFYLVPE
jgi:hypothetical protein